MENHFNYSTVAEAIEDLRKKGYTIDFNIQENCIVCNDELFHAEDFEITEVYRYEGNSDPADEATVYGIRSKTGVQGVLVTGYGSSSSQMDEIILHKLRFHH